MRSTAKGVLPSRLLMPRSIIKFDVKGLSTYVKLTNTGIFGSKGNNWHTFHAHFSHSIDTREGECMYKGIDDSNAAGLQFYLCRYSPTYRQYTF